MRFRLDIDWFVLVIGVGSAVTWVEALIKGSTMRRKLLFFVFLLHCASHLFQKGGGCFDFLIFRKVGVLIRYFFFL